MLNGLIADVLAEAGGHAAGGEEHVGLTEFAEVLRSERQDRIEGLLSDKQ